MAFLKAYLRLTTVDGRTFEVVNGARTLSHLRAGRAAAAWSTQGGARLWDGAEAWQFNEGNYEIDPTAADGNPDPWWDPQAPEALQVAGVLVDPPGDGVGFELESALSDRIARSSRVEPAELSMTFTVVAQSEAGERQVLNRLAKDLKDLTCDGVTAHVYALAPCVDDFADLIVDGQVAAPIPDPVAPSAPPGGHCDPNPPTLEPYPLALPTRIDDGYRELAGVRFVSLEPIFDAPVFPGCVGQRYRMRFEVDRGRWHSRSEHICSIGGTGSWNECDEISEPFTICEPVDTTVTCGPERTFGRRRIRTTSSLYCTPGCHLRKSCLTAPQPVSSTGRIVAEVHAGSAEIFNASVKVWEAVDGLPDPSTAVGAKLYRARAVAWEANIPHLRAGDRLVLDGRTQSATLLCGSGETFTGGGVVEGTGGSRWDPPALEAGDRYWIAFDLSNDPRSRGALDASLTVNISREEVPI